MKKILALLLCAIMLIGSAAAVSAGDFSLELGFLKDDTFKLGDVDGNGLVNAQDAFYIKASIVGVETGIDMILDAADLDADSKCGAGDSFCMKMVLSGAKTTDDFGDSMQVYKMTIAGTEITQMSIVLPEGSTEDDNVYFASLNLMKYVRYLTGYELPMSYGESTTAKAIYFHDVALDSELGQTLGIEGYRYDVTDGNLNIYGTYRGNMYAVFDILEDYLGIRFYSNSETFVYKQRVVDIPEGVSVEKIPEINFRYARHTFGRNPKWHFFPNKLNGSQLSGHDEMFYGTKIGPLYSNAHSFLEYWQMGTGTMPDESYGNISQRYQAKFDSGEKKDEYKWQPCATNNNTYNTLFEGMLDCNRMVMSWGRPTFIEEGQTLFSFSIADNQYYCTCRNCSLITNGKKDNVNTEKNEYVPPEGYSGLYLQLYNRATEDAQAYYPGVRLYGIVYAKDYPSTIKPHKNFIILYCGIGCNNHILGKEECYEYGGQLNNMSNKGDLEALPFWGNLCRETGAELWFWIYPVTYHYYLSSCPNVINLYYNMKWLHEEANVTGFFYEGGGTTYNFETLKEYVSVKFMWDPDMTYEEWTDILKEYLYINYGNGVDELYEYMLMQTEAGDQCGTCFINNFDRPGDMYSYEYLAENYEYMRGLLVTAYEKAKTDDQRSRIQNLLVCCDFMGLSSVHTDWYVNGNNKSLYMERYDWMYNSIKNKGMRVFSSDLYKLPSKIDYEENPMIQIYEEGSRRGNVYP